MSGTWSGRKWILAMTILVLCSVLLVPAAHAGKKKKKKKKKKTAQAQTSQVEQNPADRSRPSPAVEKAFRQLRAYETEAAKETLDTAGEDSVYAQTARALVLEQRKEYAGASARLRELSDRYAGEPAPAFHLGETLLHAKDMGAANDAFARAETRARAILERSPEDPEALYYLGSAQQRMRRYDEAIATLERARSIDPGNAMIVFQIGATKAFQEKWQEAYDALSEAIAKDSGIAYAYYYRGLSAGKMGRKDLLVNDLDRFLAMAPDAPEAESAKKVRGAA